MSLLMDALKKAEAEKAKKSSSQNKDQDKSPKKDISLPSELLLENESIRVESSKSNLSSQGSNSIDPDQRPDAVNLSLMPEDDTILSNSSSTLNQIPAVSTSSSNISSELETSTVDSGSSLSSLSDSNKIQESNAHLNNVTASKSVINTQNAVSAEQSKDIQQPHKKVVVNTLDDEQSQLLDGFDFIENDSNDKNNQGSNNSNFDNQPNSVATIQKPKSAISKPASLGGALSSESSNDASHNPPQTVQPLKKKIINAEENTKNKIKDKADNKVALLNKIGSHKKLLLSTAAVLLVLSVCAVYAYVKIFSNNVNTQNPILISPFSTSLPNENNNTPLNFDGSTSEFTETDTKSKNQQIESITEAAIPPNLRESKPVIKPIKKIAKVKKQQKRRIKKKQTLTNSADSSLAIKKSLEPDAIYQLLLSGYNAFQEGRHAEAKQDYLQVLKQESRNRDALLGLAAVAVRENRLPLADKYYKKVLNYYPRDTIALSGLINMRGRGAAQLNESKIKFLLENSPDNAPLLFSLGTLYLSRSRWADAQQSFFKAFAADNGNADYAYNLAVSLDHLGQNRPARKYYRLALDLVKNKPTSFNSLIVIKRINALDDMFGG